MAAFCPSFTATGVWPFDDPTLTPTATATATALYSQDLPNHPHLYFNTTTDHQVYNTNYFPNVDHFSCTDPRLIIPPALYTYNPTILPPPLPPPSMGGGDELLPPAAFGISFDGKAGPTGEDAEKKRKMYHNASERDRRKKINSLYSSLRDLLPAADRMKRLSNPDTVARAVKYIPELQKKVQLLSQKKHELLSTSSTTNTTTPSNFSSSSSSSYSVHATQLGNGEILVQISTLKSVRNIIPISEVMRNLEEEEIGLLVVDVSSSESSTGRIFHNLIFKVEAALEIKFELLKRKVLNSCQNWEIK